MLMEFIQRNAELLTALGINALIYIATFIYKQVGDARVKRLLSQVREAQDTAQKAHDALSQFTGTVESSIQRVEIDNIAVNNQLASMNVLAERIESLTKIVEETKEESRTLRDQLNNAKNKERP